MNPTVAVATCAAVVGKDEDDLQIIAALYRRGIHAVHAAWDDPSVNWSSFRLVVIRSTWDYPPRRDAFLAWAGKLPRVLNPLPILRWNTDKRYLSELAKAGVSVIATRFLEPTDSFEPPKKSFVVKPAVSCGAKDTMRLDPRDIAAAHYHVRRLQSEGRVVMVQPYLSEIEATGEVDVVFIGGDYSHSIRRSGLLKDGEPPDTPLDIQPHEPTPEERKLAEKVMSLVPGGPSQLLYGRVDLVPGPHGSPVVLEVELTEPSLFLGFSKGGADRLAGAIAAGMGQGFDQEGLQ